MIMMKQLFATSALTVLAGVAATQALAQVTPVSERMAAENAPMGMRAGSFLVIPKVDFEVESNDNVFSTDKNAKSDIIAKLRPEVAVQSNWSRHALNAVARAGVSKYADYDKNDVTDHMVALDGRADVMRDTSIGGGVSTSKNFEDRGDPDTASSSDKPVEYTLNVARIGAYRGLGKANLRADSEVKMFDYQDGETAAGANIDNDGRDRNHYTQSLRAGYAFTPGVEAYVKGATEARVYDRKPAASNRSSTGTSAVVGSVFELSGKTKGDVYVGMAERNFNAGFKDVSEPVWGAKVLWNATDLTSVMAGLDRSIEETTIGGSSANVRTAYNVGAEHAFGRRILGTAGLEFANSEYQGTAANQRDDDVMTASLGGRYIINRCLSAGAEYQFRQRDSNVANGDFDRNRVLVRLTGTY